MNEYQVTVFTEQHNVSGRGERAATLQFALSAGANRMILVAFPEQVAYRLIQGLTRYLMELMQQQGEDAFPHPALVLSREQVMYERNGEGLAPRK